jgi:PIN domain nuclease of toxin-antitoxin system
MNLIIDTHALIWHIEGNKRLKKKAAFAIENTGNSVYVSKASLWEMAIKIGLGKLEMSIPFDELEVYLGKNEFLILDYNFEHLKTLLTLPFHHSDPFDRLIISQAITDDLTVITHDSIFRNYSVKLLPL